MLFRRDLLARIAPLDELSVWLHIDCSLRIREAGERILLEPAALVGYDETRVRRLEGQDRAYLRYRWDLQRAQRSLDRFAARWAVAPESVAAKLAWAHRRMEGTARTRALIAGVRGKLRRLAGI